MSLEPPELLRDLYRDMRDRHLLIVAVALLAAIVAVPVLLGGGGEEPAAEGPPFVGVADEAPEAQPVVVANTPELRDFRDRLDVFKSRNPFRQQLTSPVGGSLDDSGDGSLDTDSGGGSGSGDTDLGPIDPDGGPVPLPDDDGGGDDPVAPTPAPPGPPDDGGGGGGGNGGGGGDRLVFHEIDVRIGPVGDTEVIRDARSLDYLPSRRDPLLQYLMSTFGAEDASFSVSSAVTDTSGDGQCEPTPRACRFLRLEVGDEHRFTYGGEGAYRVELLRVTRKEKPVRMTAAASKDAAIGAGHLVLAGP